MDKEYWRKKALRNVFEKKRIEQKKIDEWAKTEWEDLIKKVREKSKSNINPEDLPF